MSSLTKRKYIDSHWLIFAMQGVFALLFGWFALFNNIQETASLVAIVGVTLLGLGIIELFNVLYRKRAKETWAISLGVAVVEIVIAMSLLFTINQNPAWHMIVISLFTLIRGVCEILIGFKSIDDVTDKAIWVITGTCGAILGFVILNAGRLNDQAFIQFFGSYMMIFGLANLIYGIHNHDQAKAYKEERQAIAKKAAATRKKSKK